MFEINRLGLGTVQWGLSYGIANENGVVPSEIVRSILVKSEKIGLKVLDTASAYGDAEKILGLHPLEKFNVVTKTPRLSESSVSEIELNSIKSRFKESLKNLGCKKIYGLLVHNANDIFLPGGEKIIEALEQFKEKGQLDKIGVSVYDGEEVDNVMKVFKPDLIQLPLNVFDQRMLLSGHLERLKAEGVEIHVRSVFLQGLLLMPLNRIPKFFDPIKPLLLKWHDSIRDQGFTLTQAALSFIRSIPQVDNILIGVDGMNQFNECIEDFSFERDFDAKGLECNDPSFLNPALWNVE